MKKEKNKEFEDLPYSFWKKYEEADLLERDKILEPIVKNFLPIIKLKEEKMKSHILTTYLRSYFDDLIDYFYSKEIKKKR